MGYTVVTGLSHVVVEAAHESGEGALAFAFELVRQGRRNVRIIDGQGISRTAEDFEASVRVPGTA